MAARGGLGSLTVSLGLDSADFTDGLTKAQAQAQKFADSVKAIALGEAIGEQISQFAEKAYDALKELTVGAFETADQLNNLSKNAGVSIEALGGIAFAASKVGGTLEDTAASIGKLNKSIAEAASDSSSKAAGAFKAIGVSVTDAAGKTKSADQVFAEVADKFATYADGPEKAAIALQLFGKAGAAQIALLDQGGQALQDNIAYYQRYSGVTQETADKASAFSDTLTNINLINKSFGQLILAETLPILQGLANAYLDTKENSDLFKNAATALRVVLETLVVTGATVRDTFIGVGDTLGAYAAVSARLLQGDVAGATAIGKAYQQAGEERKKQLDAFNSSVLKTPTVANGDSTPTKDFGTFSKLPQAPKLPAAGAASAAEAALKKQLDGQLKLIQQFAKDQADGYALANTYLDGVYKDGLVSQQEYFDTQKQVRAVALQDQVDDFNKQIALLQAFIANPATKQVDRIDAENKVKEAVQARDAAVTKASAAEILANQQNARAVESLAVSYANLQASILAAQGNDVGAQAIKNAQELKAAAILITQAEGDPAALGALEQIQALQVTRTQLTKDYAKLLDTTANREAEIYLDAEAGGKSELETLLAIKDARTVAINQLQQQATAAAALAAVSGTDADAKKAADLALSVKKAASEIDPVAKAINSSLEDSFGSAFSEFITGAKSAKDAFKDFANSVISNIADIASKQLAKQVFGDLGGSSGVGGLLSGLLSNYQASQNNVNYSNEGAHNPIPLAAGTNYVPYDGFAATLHKGEAVVPAKYNQGGPAAPVVNITNTAGVQVTPSTGSDGSVHLLIETAVDQAHSAVAADFASGTGRASRAAATRFGLGAGALPKRN